MDKTRTVFIAQEGDNRFSVAFNCRSDCYPTKSNQQPYQHIRKYYPVTSKSLDRLNRLVYLAPKTVRITAHLSPYICIWVTFPPKEASHV